MRIPGGLTVVVRVDVDEPRRDERTVGIDAPSGRPVDLADLDDHTVAHRHVGAARLGAGAVHDGAAGDHQVVAHRSAR